MFRALSLLIACGFVAGLTPAAHAQKSSFSFSISNGHSHGHHGCYDHWHPSYCWHDHYCAPPLSFVYVQPQPVVRQQITYVQPVQPVVTETYETRVVVPPAQPMYSGRSAAISSAATTSSAAPLQIWNSAGRQARVSFLVNGQEVSLADGQSHTVYSGGTRVIEFDRGGDFGSARFDLSGGEYEFVVTNNGWDLVEQRAGNVATRPVLKKNTLPR